MNTQSLTVGRLKEALDYNPETGVFTWAESRRGVRRGRIAGSIGNNGHFVIGVDKVKYLAQRLAWLYVHGGWPKSRVAFADGDPLNIRIANLAESASLPKRFDHATSEGRSAYLKAHRAAHPNHYRNKSLVRDFGIDLAEYQRLFVEQKGVCAICSQPETEKRGGKTKWLAVDHDHSTGAVRGLLCTACNKGIGLLQDSVAVLTSAIAYLKVHTKSADTAPDNVVPLMKKDAS